MRKILPILLSNYLVPGSLPDGPHRRAPDT